MKKKKVIITAVVIVAAAAIILPRFLKPKEEVAAASVPVVSIQKPEIGNIELYTGLTGTVEPSDIVYIIPKAAGEVTDVYVKAGDYVEEGQELLHIDTKQVDGALLHRPQILFLDEPTSGLDPESAQNVNSLIQEQAAEGITVFLCTHQLRYAQEICTTYGLMDKGHLFATGNITELRAMVSRNRRVRVKASCLPKDMVYQEIGDHIYDVDVASEHDIPLIVKRIVEAGGDLYHVSEQQMSLEEIYFSLIDREHAETERENT